MEQKNSKWKAIVNSNLSFGRKRMCQKKKKTEEGTPEKKVERENRKEKRKRKNC